MERTPEIPIDTAESTSNTLDKIEPKPDPKPKKVGLKISVTNIPPKKEIVKEPPFIARVNSGGIKPMPRQYGLLRTDLKKQ
jgi:hypothetical protein